MEAPKTDEELEPSTDGYTCQQTVADNAEAPNQPPETKTLRVRDVVVGLSAENVRF